MFYIAYTKLSNSCSVLLHKQVFYIVFKKLSNSCSVLLHKQVFYKGKSKTCNGTKRNEIEMKRNGTKRNEIVLFLVLVFICV